MGMKEKLLQQNPDSDEEMTVTLDLEDDSQVVCSIVTVFTVQDKDYIALLPLNEDSENDTGEVWIYGYSENPDDSNEEPVLRTIEDDEEYEIVSDAFDEFLDQNEFDELVSEEDSE